MNHLPHIPLHVHKSTSHFVSLIYMFSHQSSKSNERAADDSPFRRFIMISAMDRKCSISTFNKKKYHKSINNMQKKKLITIAAFVQSLFHLRLCQFVKWIENSQEKFEHWKSKCLRKMGSFHRNLNLEKALVLWCAASEVKTEARFEISTKFYLRYMSLELSYTVWKFFGTP